jgi:hypothetical protein
VNARNAPELRLGDRSISVPVASMGRWSERPRDRFASRRSARAYGRRVRGVGSVARRARRCLDGGDARNRARRVRHGRSDGAPDHRRTGILVGCDRSAEHPWKSTAPRAWNDRFAFRRHHGVRAARLSLNRHRADPDAEHRSNRYPVDQYLEGRRDSRSVVAHQRRDEAMDFERAPDNPTKGSRRPVVVTTSQVPPGMATSSCDGILASRESHSVTHCQRRVRALDSRPATVRSGTCHE